jgi:hypothetical protein
VIHESDTRSRSRGLLVQGHGSSLGGIPFHARHEEELLTPDEVAEILTTSPNTVRWWRQRGTGPEFFKIGRRLYTTVGDLRRWIREQRLASQPVIGRPKAV